MLFVRLGGTLTAAVRNGELESVLAQVNLAPDAVSCRGEKPAGLISQDFARNAAGIVPTYTFVIPKNLMFELQRIIFTWIDAANCPICEAYRKVASVFGSVI